MSYNHFALTCLLLLFHSVYANSQVHYYITPTLSVHCPGEHCLILTQFAADSTSYLGNETNNVIVLY